MPIEDADFVVLGAGLAGLAAASALGERALVLEREARPGGLVRTERFGAYWFDRVIHLLYFDDAQTEMRLRELLGATLVPCPPVSWVETAAGVARYPLQSNLADLSPEVVVSCLRDLARARGQSANDPPPHFQAWLERSFGDTLCRLFFLPYNRKVWKRPLTQLAPSGFQWNIARPDLDAMVSGVLRRHVEVEATSYNARGWYPRPERGAPVRGMEVLSRALAARVQRLRLQHEVREIDLERRIVHVRVHGEERTFRFARACLATLPLPEVVRLCRQAPAALRDACAHLTANRVLSAAISVRGPRPVGCGHWRYYADESLVFNRLIFLHEFDPYGAPEDGWPLLAELTEPAEAPLPDANAVLARVRADLDRAGALPHGSEVVDQHLLLVDPAYVVFTPENARVVQRARDFLRRSGVEPLGRYGRWEYSSMAQVMRDGFEWAANQGSEIEVARRSPEARA